MKTVLVAVAALPAPAALALPGSRWWWDVRANIAEAAVWTPKA